MGFSSGCDVFVAYAMELPTITHPRAFAVKCLLAHTQPQSQSQHLHPPNQYNGRRRPRDNTRDTVFNMFLFQDMLYDKDGGDDLYFDDVVAEVQLSLLNAREKQLYETLKCECDNRLYGWYEDDLEPHEHKLIGRAFQCFVERLFPGQGRRFKLKLVEDSGADGKAGKTAKTESAYLYLAETMISQNPKKKASENCGDSRSGLNAPWGVKMTKLVIPEDLVELDAAMRVIADSMGAVSVSAPGFKLITDASGG